ncbi:MAG: hypothetical protein HY875_02425 [Chloroflexi bacterium]|nr:hypothetical protein [Chloroflexota bacterium]
MTTARKVAVAGVVAAVLLGGAALGFFVGDGSSGATRSDKEHTIDLGTQPPDVVAAYRYIESHPEMASRIPCYCGCGKSLGHQSLLDCYVIVPGTYSDHASVCLICGREAADLERLAAEGQELSAIRAWIDGEYSPYGPPTNTRE